MKFSLFKCEFVTVRNGKKFQLTDPSLIHEIDTAIDDLTNIEDHPPFKGSLGGSNSITRSSRDSKENNKKVGDLKLFLYHFGASVDLELEEY
ncbi:hypothetical protein ACTXT7_002893 [Hymenolepis weldensis]